MNWGKLLKLLNLLASWNDRRKLIFQKSIIISTMLAKKKYRFKQRNKFEIKNYKIRLFIQIS